MQNLFHKVKNLIKRAIIVGLRSNIDDVQRVEVSYLGKQGRPAELVYPYGTFGIPPIGTQFLLLNANAQEENRLGIGYANVERYKAVNEGDCGLYNQVSQNLVLLDNQVLVSSTSQINLVAVGNVNITAQNVTVNAPQNTVNGNVLINGNVGVAPGFITTLGDPLSAQPLARVGDQVEVVIDIGSSAGTYTGTITSGGVNISD